MGICEEYPSQEWYMFVGAFLHNFCCSDLIRYRAVLPHIYGHFCIHPETRPTITSSSIPDPDTKPASDTKSSPSVPCQFSASAATSDMPALSAFHQVLVSDTRPDGLDGDTTYFLFPSCPLSNWELGLIPKGMTRCWKTRRRCMCCC